MSGKVHRFKEVTSTQDVSRRLLAEGTAREGEVIVADYQTAGRGRFGRVWRSPIGGLYATFICERSRLISIRTGVSLISALERFGLRARLKWPNDVVVDREKLGGVIVEEASGIALVGVGVNLDRSPLPGSTCVSAHGVKIDRDSLLQAISVELSVELGDDELLDAYRASSATIGHRVSVVRGPRTGPIVGIARWIDDRGRLLVETPDGVRPVASGECFHLRFPAVDAGRFARLS